MVEGSTAVYLEATATDTDGTINSIEWTQISNSEIITLHDEKTAKASFYTPEVTTETILTFQFTAQDNNGASTSKNINITVTPPAQILTGTFVDGATAGAAYTTSSGLTGKTDANGQYQYKKGDTVSFFVGDIKLGELTAKSIVTVLDFENPEQSAVLLQSLDEDNNPANGINISEDTFNKLKGVSVTLDTLDLQNTSSVQAFEEATNIEIKTTAYDALEHAQKAYGTEKIKNFAFYQYYIGNLNLSTTRFNVDALNASASKRLNLYMYNYRIKAERNLIRTTLLNEDKSDDEFHANIINSISETNSIVSSINDVLEGDGFSTLVNNNDNAKELYESLKKEFATQMFAELKATSFSDFDTLVRELSIQDGDNLIGGPMGSAGLYGLSKLAQSLDACNVVNKSKIDPFACTAHLTAEVVSIGNDFKAAFAKYNTSKGLNTLTVASAYLDAHFRMGGDINKLRSSFQVTYEAKSSSDATIRYVLENILKKQVLTASTGILTNGEYLYDQDLALKYITDWKAEVNAATNALIEKYGLNTNLQTGQAAPFLQVNLDPSKISLTNSNGYKLNFCYTVKNNSVAKINDLKLSLLFSAYGSDDNVGATQLTVIETASNSPAIEGSKSLEKCDVVNLSSDISALVIAGGQFNLSIEANSAQYNANVIDELYLFNDGPELQGLLAQLAPPIIEADALQNVYYAGDTVTINASRSTVPNVQGSLGFLWQQGLLSSSPQLSLTGGNSNTVSFVVPSLTTGKEKQTLALKLKLTASISKKATEKVFIINVVKKLTDVADGFDYPIGDRGYTSGKYAVIAEQITEEKNTYSETSPIATTNHTRQAKSNADATKWRNASDVGNYLNGTYTAGLHPGEDWNLGVGNDDAGQAVYAVAGGQIERIQSTFNSGYLVGGWTIIVKHKTNDGDVYSYYTHVTSADTSNGDLVTKDSAFTIKVGYPVTKGQIIARLANGSQMTGITSSHLHFEMRTKALATSDMWPDDNGNGYYTDNNTKITQGMTAQQVTDTFIKMKTVGIIDPSDYIEKNRIPLYQLANSNVTNITHDPLIKGQTATFTIEGNNLPVSIVFGIQDGNCGQTYNITSTQVKVDCSIPSLASNSYAFYTAAYSGGVTITGAESKIVNIYIPDTTKPVFTLPAKLIIVSDSNVAVSDNRIQAFLSSATAQDDTDGNISSSITHNIATDYSFIVGEVKTVKFTVTDQAGNVTLGLVAIEIKFPSTTKLVKLNDTGITWGGNYSSGNNATCIGETVAEQDCSKGRDAQALAGNLTKIGAGNAGFDFSKLDTNGDSLPTSATSWSCVKDNHTGLVWEVKTADGGLHDKNDRYNWYNTNALTNGGANGYADDDGNICEGYITGNIATYCNTQAYTARVNSQSLCGVTDWRIPNRKELRSIVNYSKTNPAIDTGYFPNTVSTWYWSSSPYASLSGGAWIVYFLNGSDSYDGRGRNNRVRLVSGGQ